MLNRLQRKRSKPSVTQEEYREAVSLAEEVVRWAEGMVRFRSAFPSEEHPDQEP
jgi:hypothetical protein